MKTTVLFTLATLLLAPAFASAESCLGKARIAASVSERQTDNLTYCRAKVSAELITFFASSQVCPINQATVITQGIEMPLTNGHDCEIHNGANISGVLVLDANGKIHLE